MHATLRLPVRHTQPQCSENRAVGAPAAAVPAFSPYHTAPGRRAPPGFGAAAAAVSPCRAETLPAAAPGCSAETKQDHTGGKPPCAAAALPSPCSPALVPTAAGAFPDRPITLVTGYAPGGSTDIAARILADRMPAHLGPEARMVVDNRPGAAGVIATEWLKRQPADGYTIMVTETGAAAAAPAAMIGGTRYDPITDFTHIGIVSTPPGVLVVTESLPGRTPEEVLETLRPRRPTADLCEFRRRRGAAPAGGDARPGLRHTLRPCALPQRCADGAVNHDGGIAIRHRRPRLRHAADA